MGDDGEFDYFECPDCGFDSVQRADLGWVIVECEARITELEGERDTATRALEAIGSLAVMSEGNVAGGVVSSREVDAIINAALSKTEGEGMSMRTRGLQASKHQPKPRDPSLLDRLFEAQDGYCFFCTGQIMHGGHREAGYNREHVFPKATSGRGLMNNIVLGHPRCNQKKWGREPTAAEIARAKAIYARIGLVAFIPAVAPNGE